MYAQLKLELAADDIDYKKSSNLQGIIMENIDTEYAGILHGNQLNPYSQCLIREDGKNIWCIKTLTKEAYKQIIQPMSEVKLVTFKKSSREVGLIKRQLEWCEERELLDEFYDVPCPKYLDVQFLTPTAFKQDGHYVIYPDLRLIYGSLMRKYSAVSGELDMVDEDLLNQLTDYSSITRYRLQTILFPLEKTNITGFVGNISIRVHGPETLARYVRLLLRFGEFSGVGIKTGMGMGAMRYNRRETR